MIIFANIGIWGLVFFFFFFCLMIIWTNSDRPKKTKQNKTHTHTKTLFYSPNWPIFSVLGDSSFSPLFCQNLVKSAVFFEFFCVFKVIFAIKKKKRIKNKKNKKINSPKLQPTNPTWKVRPPVKQGFFFMLFCFVFFCCLIFTVLQILKPMWGSDTNHHLCYHL